MRWHGQKIKDEVRLLRYSGLSLDQIQQRVKIPKTTIYGWIKDVRLTSRQKEILKSRAIMRLQEGNIRAIKLRNLERESLRDKLALDGIVRIGELSDKELFIAGVALYWGEGFKNPHERRLGFCNSDPTMLRFYLHWLKKCLNVESKDLIARLTLNKSYEAKTEEIISYWIKVTSIPRHQFTKTFYQNSVWKKQYNTDNYFGVLRIHVKGSLDELLRMKGFIEGLRLNMPG